MLEVFELHINEIGPGNNALAENAQPHGKINLGDTALRFVPTGYDHGQTRFFGDFNKLLNRLGTGVGQCIGTDLDRFSALLDSRLQLLIETANIRH